MQSTKTALVFDSCLFQIHKYELGLVFPSWLHVCLAKSLISLRVFTVWSGSWQVILWIAKDPKRHQADNEDSDQPVQVNKCNFVGINMSRLM